MSRLNVSRQRIIQAAIDLFARHGSARLTVSQLAEAAGVTRATIYNNGLHPQTLFQDVCLSLKREMDQRIDTSLQGVDDPPQRLVQVVHFYLPSTLYLSVLWIFDSILRHYKLKVAHHWQMRFPLQGINAYL